MKQKKNSRINCIILVILFLLPWSVNGESWWNVYFTDPKVKKLDLLNRNNPETAILRLIKNSKKSFYGAFYETSSMPVIKELIDTQKRGVEVKLVLEKDYINKKETRELIKAGISIITDNRKPLMHNKFAIIDGDIAWTGSYNLTYNDAHKNNNNAIEIHSKDVAAIYYSEFSEMFNDNIFGNKKDSGIFAKFRKKNSCRIGSSDIYVYFSPEDDIENEIVKRLEKTQKSVYFLAFSFTNNRIGEELIKLHKKGIKIRGVIEKIGSNSKESEYIKFKVENIPVVLDKNKYRMHDKVIVIDGECLMTGSFNYSKGANEKNDENIIIINNKEISDLYLEEFRKLYGKI